MEKETVEEMYYNQKEAFRLLECLDGIDEVEKNPNFKKNGFTAEIRDNGTIVLRAIKSREYHSSDLSKKDSKHLLNIIRIGIKEKMMKLNE